MRSCILCLLPVFLAASCESGGMGHVSPALVDLYDLADPMGVMEIELDRDGRVREMEAEVPLDALPEPVRKAAAFHAPGGKLVGAEREVQAAAAECWEVKLAWEGRDWEMIFDGQGNLIESEKSLGVNEVPALVAAAAEAEMPGRTWKSIEVIERGGAAAEYHFKKDLQGASYKVIVGADGKLLRKVREQRAEIEIPLR